RLLAQDFHEDLIHTIRGLLKPSGRAVFVQPQRGGTVDLFLERVAATRLLDRYDGLVWDMHKEYVRASGGGNGDGDDETTA
ncbi:unnamed protein product, partial [Scytosiphon promiscuus]